jgi:hypothetical protein
MSHPNHQSDSQFVQTSSLQHDRTIQFAHSNNQLLIIIAMHGNIQERFVETNCLRSNFRPKFADKQSRRALLNQGENLGTISTQSTSRDDQ